MRGLLRRTWAWSTIMAVTVAAARQRQATPTIRARQDTTNPIPFPTGTPLLAFDKINMATTCQSGSVIWRYSGPESIQMDLVVTNVNVPQDGTNPATINTHTDGSPRRRSTPLHQDVSITETIISMDPGTQIYVWPKINVPQGNYMLQANFPAFQTQATSESFFITNGTDVSCLLSTPPSSTSSIASSTGTTGSMTSSSTNPTSSSGGSNTSEPPSNPSAPGQVGAVSSGGANKGAIAGGVVGGLALLALLFAAFLFFRCSPGVRRRDPYSGKWGNISSYDSKASKTSKAGFGLGARNAAGSGFGGALSAGIGLADPKSSTRSKSSKHKNQSESMGAMMALSSASPSAHGHSGAGGDFVDSENTLGAGDSEEKIYSDMSHDMGLLGAPIVTYSTSSGLGRSPVRNSSQSTTSSVAYLSPRPHSSGLGGTSPSPQTFPESISNSRRTSAQSQFQTAPTSAHASDVSLSGVPFTSSSRPLTATGNESNTSIPTPSAASFPPVPATVRPVIATTPTTPTARKTPRKPVPRYAPTAAEHPDLDVPSDIQPGEAQKQMHYLIPDPVPPQRN